MTLGKCAFRSVGRQTRFGAGGGLPLHIAYVMVERQLEKEERIEVRGRQQ